MRQQAQLPRSHVSAAIAGGDPGERPRGPRGPRCVVTLRRTLVAIGLAAGLLGPVAGCHGQRTRPPYTLTSRPTADLLLKAAEPELAGIRVSAAKIRLNHSIAGTLMFLAERPERFVGQIQISGKELVSLAFHEEGYALRYLSGEGLPPGFYSGPPSACAIAQLLGVPLAPRELIALVLGGAPVIAGSLEIISQRWDRKAGHEVLRVRSGPLEEELRFAWFNDRWWPAGASLYRRLGSRETLWLWTILHESPHLVDGLPLPTKTVITRPDGRRKQKVSIAYRDQEPNPKLPGAGSASSAGADSAGSDEGWDDDGGWESDEGWESEGDEPEEQVDGSSAAPAPIEPARPGLPAHFILSGDGLPRRGHLCRDG